MKYFAKLILEGFQSHSYTEITFNRGLNVITGPSDSGKSAIIRAMRWVLFNEPRGTDFIRQGETTCKVTLIMSDGVEIIRERSRGKNRYYLRKDGMEDVYEGFTHTGVPEEILTAHGIRPVKFDEADERFISIGYQLDGPFLMSESAALRAKAIGRIGGVHIIDTASRSVQRDLFSLNRAEREEENRLTELQTQLDQFADLETLRLQIMNLHEGRRKIHELVERYQSLKAKKEQYETLRERYAQVIKVEEMLSQLDLMIEMKEDLIKKHAELERLNRFAEQLTDLKKRHSFAVLYIEKTAHTQKGEQLLMGTERYRQHGQQLYQLFKGYNEAKQRYQKSVEFLAQTKVVTEVDERIHRVDQLIPILRFYSEQQQTLSKAYMERKQVEEILQQTETHQLVTDKLNALDEHREKMNRLLPLYTDRERLIRTSLERDNEMKQVEVKLKDYITAYRTLLQDVGKCPTCYTHMTPEALERITREYEEGVIDRE